MEVHLTRDLEEQLAVVAMQAGCPADELAREAIAGYLAEVAEVRSLLDGRYDDVRSGGVKLIPGDEVEAYFAGKSAAARRARSGL